MLHCVLEGGRERKRERELQKETLIKIGFPYNAPFYLPPRGRGGLSDLSFVGFSLARVNAPTASGRTGLGASRYSQSKHKE